MAASAAPEATPLREAAFSRFMGDSPPDRPPDRSWIRGAVGGDSGLGSHLLELGRCCPRALVPRVFGYHLLTSVGHPFTFIFEVILNANLSPAYFFDFYWVVRASLC